MRLLTLKEIQALEIGETIPSFKAQIKESKPYNKGVHAEYGPWTIQNLTVMDGSGIVPVKIKNHPEFGKDWFQKWVLFECGISKKDGSLAGIRWKEDTYKGNTTRVIEVNALATVEAIRVNPSTPEPEPEQEPEIPFDQLSDQKPEPKQSALPDTKEAIQNARERLGKAANGLILCYDAAVYVALEVMKKHPDMVFRPEELEKIAVHLSISLEKSGAVHGLPAGPLDQWLKKVDP